MFIHSLRTVVLFHCFIIELQFSIGWVYKIIISPPWMHTCIFKGNIYNCILAACNSNPDPPCVGPYVLNQKYQKKPVSEALGICSQPALFAVA